MASNEGNLLIMFESLFSILIANQWLLFVVILVAAVVAILTVHLLSGLRKTDDTAASTIVSEVDDFDYPDSESDGLFGSLTPALAAQIPESEQESKDFLKLLRSAGLYRPSARASIYAIRFVLLIVPLVIGGILLVVLSDHYRWQIIGGTLGAAGVLTILPRFYVYRRKNSRSRQIREGLADMMDMLSMCLSGGLPIGPSLEHVAGNLDNFPALAEELQILKRQTEVGGLKHALDDFADRIAISEARQLTFLLARGEQLGTRLSHSLLEQADHFRATRKQLATMQANRAPVQLSLPLLFCFAPAALILLMSPALLELRDFMRGSSDQNITTGNAISEIQSLDQNQSGIEAVSTTTP